MTGGDDELGSIGYFLRRPAADEGAGGLAEDEGGECINLLESEYPNECEELAATGECHLNPWYRMEQCAKSCLVCLPAGAETFEIGVLYHK